MADEAIARAKELDEYYKKTGKLVGPLVRTHMMEKLRPPWANSRLSMAFPSVLRSISGLRDEFAIQDMLHGKTVQNHIVNCSLVSNYGL